jgi:hypothetical protein
LGDAWARPAMDKLNAVEITGKYCCKYFDMFSSHKGWHSLFLCGDRRDAKIIGEFVLV